MTGMGSDGTLGLKLMKRNGAAIIAQDEETCIVYGMPKVPVEAGIVDVIAPCATGQEVFIIAIVLKELLLTTQPRPGGNHEQFQNISG